MLYLSVLLHEASHAVMAQRLGYGVNSITLHFLGGMTEIDGQSRTPAPGVLDRRRRPADLDRGRASPRSALWFVVPDGLVRVAIEGLAGANLLIGVLNLVPGLPLDGGRVLKAVVWGASGNQHRGTIVAGWGGRLTAVALLAWPLVQEPLIGEPPDAPRLRPGLHPRPLPLDRRDRRDGARPAPRAPPALVARPLARRTLTVPDDLPLAEAVRRAQEAEAGSIVTVTPDGTPLGIVSEAAVLAMPEDRRPWVPVSTVARTLEDGLTPARRRSPARS